VESAGVSLAFVLCPAHWNEGPDAAGDKEGKWVLAGISWWRGERMSQSCCLFSRSMLPSAIGSISAPVLGYRVGGVRFHYGYHFQWQNPIEQGQAD